jgi:aldose 1-epimerase
VPLVTVADGDIEVQVLPEVGARLHRLRVAGRDLLRTPPDVDAHAREPIFWGSYVMAPWCNRMEGGTRVSVGSRVVEPAPNFPDGTAIHGQVFARPWQHDGEGSFAMRAGGDGWPWEYEVRQRIRVPPGEDRLHLEHRLTNRSDEAMPAGIGIHPWFLRPLRIAIAAERVYAANTAPEREPVPVSGPFDLRRMRDVPDDLDGCWAEVGDPAVSLRWPAVGLAATLRARVRLGGGGAAPAVHIVVASPSHLDAVGVEPQTNAPGGLRRLLDGAPGGLVMLGPGEALGLDVELGFARL